MGGPQDRAIGTHFAPTASVSHNIRIATIDGEPWFLTSDACKVLGLRSHKGSYSHHIQDFDPSERHTIPRSAVGLGKRGGLASFISESGLYKLIMRSDKPEARAFQDWVTKEVLPSIRKTGSTI